MAFGSLTFCVSLKRDTLSPTHTSSLSAYLRPTIKVSNFTPKISHLSSSSSTSFFSITSWWSVSILLKFRDSDEEVAVATIVESTRSTSTLWFSENSNCSWHVVSDTCEGSCVRLSGRVKFNWSRVRCVSFRFVPLRLGSERHESEKLKWKLQINLKCMYQTRVNYVIFSNYWVSMYLSGLVSVHLLTPDTYQIPDTPSVRDVDVVDWKLKWKNDNERSITEMRVDEAVIIGKREWTNGADNDVIFEGVATGCSRLFRLLVWERNGIGEDRMTIGKETTTFSD